MKLIFFVSYLGNGGVENYLLRFCNYQNKKHDITIICKNGKKGPLYNDFIQCGVKVVPMSIGYTNLLDLFRLWRLINKCNPDAVCDFTGNFSGSTTLISRLSNVKVRVASYRESQYQFKMSKLKMIYSEVQKFLVKKCSTHIISNSRAGLDYFHPGWTANRNSFSLINNGIPKFKLISGDSRKKIRTELGIPENAFLVGHIGRYTEAKNHKRIAWFINTITKKYNNVYFILVGSDVPNNFSKYIDLKLQGKVFLLEHRSDILSLVQCMDLFYFPSFNEGQPNALLEAMVAGTPFIASKIPPICEATPDFCSINLFDISSEDDINIFDSIYKNIDSFPSEKLKHWSKKKYDLETNFKKFESILEGNYYEN